MAAGLLGAPSALAQPNPNATPTAGTVSLEAGFTPDPRAVDLETGAGQSAAAVSAECPGSVGTAPSVVLDYDAEAGLPLHLFVRSSSDTVLLVHLPDGTWACNDDEEGLNAGLFVQEAGSGRYAIWVGSFSGEEGMETTAPATLYFSELYDEEPALNADARPTGGTLALESGGFASDPYELSVTAGGPVSALPFECTGFVDPEAPTARLDFDSNGAQPLYVYARAASDDDLTLLVMDPDGTVHCNDDAEDLNPGLMIEGPPAGRYSVWVGTFSSRARTEDPVRATLFVSETTGPVGMDFSEGDFMDGDMMMEEGVYEGGDDISRFAAPAHGTRTLAPGFGEEEVRVEAGGSDPVSVMGMGCAGSISNDEPDLNVMYDSDTASEGVLAFSVSSDDDTTLLVNLPDGTWRCSDDEVDRNPVVVIEAPEGGLYNVWVGMYDSGGSPMPATLRIAERDPR